MTSNALNIHLRENIHCKVFFFLLITVLCITSKNTAQSLNLNKLPIYPSTWHIQNCVVWEKNNIVYKNITKLKQTVL